MHALPKSLSWCAATGHSWTSIRLNSSGSPHRVDRRNLLWVLDIPSTSERNLGVYFDADLSMRLHVDIISGRCFASQRQLRGIRRYVAASISCSRAWRHWFRLVWITATVRCSVYRPFGLHGCSQYRTLQLDQYLICGWLIISPTPWYAFIGCASPSGSDLR